MAAHPAIIPACLLAELEPHEWSTPSLCSAWRVRDVVAHIASYDRLTPRDLLRRLAALFGGRIALTDTRTTIRTSGDHSESRETSQRAGSVRPCRLRPAPPLRGPGGCAAYASPPRTWDVVRHGTRCARHGRTDPHDDGWPPGHRARTAGTKLPSPGTTDRRSTRWVSTRALLPPLARRNTHGA